MKSEQLFKFKILFEKEHRSLTEKINLLKDGFHIQEEDLLDSSDLVSRQLEASVQIHLRNREVSYLRKIEQALRRITDGSFGCCVDCGKDISIKRLEARPTAVLCIDCKELQEFQEHQSADQDRQSYYTTRLRLA